MKHRYTILALLLVVSTALATSWFTEGNQPLAGDTSGKSLQKVNQLLYSGTSSAAPTLATSRLTVWYSYQTTGNDAGGAYRLASGSTLARKAVIRAAAGNPSAVGISPDDAGAAFYLVPSEEFTIEAPAGCVFDLYNWITDSFGTHTIDIIYLQ